MDAQFDETTEGAPSNSVGIERRQRCDEGMPESTSTRPAEAPATARAVSVDLQRLLPARRRRPMFAPRPVRAPAPPGAGDAPAVAHGDRAPHAQALPRLEDEKRHLAHRPIAPFPHDLLRGSGCVDPLPSEVRRVAVHGMKKTSEAAAAECYGVFLYDADGREHKFMHYDDAASATYAALWLGQTHRIGVEFSNFNDPKMLRPLRY